MTPSETKTLPRKKSRKWRNWWVKQLHSWHWISAAISLAVMLFFAVTGITLNHAASIPAEPVVTERSARLEPSVLRTLTAKSDDAPLPAPVAEAVRNAVGLDAAGKPGEWSDAEVYVALPRPGGDAWVSIDRATGKVSAEVTDRGWISYLNDLHKGRNSGSAWFWFIDLFAVACLLFTITGLFLLQVHARHRRSTWPIVIAGIALPVVLAMIFVH
ncbi:PepSY-associated TM helix domain-containing protein [Novosphingobium clariflavum]|uniref:PepSY-associated TM helix domain-containing protein n=1 Tax=Novosphingobium clariflavum TaxID=2029884 RepID=A0ABV6SAG2_9SPHN|nr:PepSY-associated TM helix domain-containing protein [Novosphingobium clariflavum]